MLIQVGGVVSAPDGTGSLRFNEEGEDLHRKASEKQEQFGS